VRRITPIQATPDSIQYELELLSGLAGLKRAIGNDSVLDGGDDDSVYRLR
jgi:hypothetical protein